MLILIIEKNVFRHLMCLNYLTTDSRPFIVKTHDHKSLTLYYLFNNIAIFRDI